MLAITVSGNHGVLGYPALMQIAPTRRDLLGLIGAAAGGAAMYVAMTALGHAEESRYAGPLKLDGDPKGARVLVLGAGVAGMVAAMELRQAGYQVELLEFNDRVGGRTWTIRGGDRYTEMGGAVQECGFDPGLYLNPGPWRIPYHHRGLLDYCKRLGVALEPFTQVNHNAYLHASKSFGGTPQRCRLRGDVSSQFLTALLQVAPYAQSDVEIEIVGELISKPYIAITQSVMRSFGVEMENDDHRILRVASGQRAIRVATMPYRG